MPALLGSAEAYSIMLDCDYLHILHRSPDLQGKQLWLNLMVSGQDTPAMVSEAFLASDEFFAQAKRASLA